LVFLNILMLVKVLNNEVRDSDGGSVLETVDVVQALGLDEFEVLSSVLVLHVWLGIEVQLVVLAK